MVKRLLNILRNVRYSLPMQLLFTQLRNHKLLLFTWLFVVLVFTGQWLDDAGAGYLFLEPEYMNRVDFASMFILGISFGIFSLAYQMTCYILDGYRFFFLGLERRPFMTFSINNSLLPLLFWLVYIFTYLSFHSHNEHLSLGDMLWNLSGALLGGVVVTTASILYFSVRNKDVLKLFGERIVSELRNPSVVVREARRTLSQTERVDWFFSRFTRIERVQKNIKGDLRYLVKVLNQNQANALILEVLLFLLLLILGVFQDNKYFRIPAASSFMLLFSFIIMIMGAVAFWFRKVGPITVVLVLALLAFLNQFKPIVGENYAFGLDYERLPRHYDYHELRQMANAQNIMADSLNTISILEKWKNKNQVIGQPKPQMVILCVSGGGNRSALWVTHCLQTLDRQLEGTLRDRLALITGASGGMIGAGYWRELVRRAAEGQKTDPNDPKYLEGVSKDLLNPVVVNLTTHLVLPNLMWEYDGRTYEKDRGYSFDNQLAENLPELKGLHIRDYAQAEWEARIPMLILSPTIANDARHLYISPHPHSYLMKARTFNEAYRNEVTGVDFQRLFSAHNAGGLRFTTAIRMNATFPTILPYVELPTSPSISIMDAGVLDNFGISTTLRFLHHFRDWIGKNTSGVLIIQIRDTQREQKTLIRKPKTVLSKIVSLFGGPLTGYSKGKDYLNDEALDHASDWLQVPLQTVDLQYIPDPTFKGAALSFHLTEREKQDILSAINNIENRQAIQVIMKLLMPGKLEEAEKAKSAYTPSASFGPAR